MSDMKACNILHYERTSLRNAMYFYTKIKWMKNGIYYNHLKFFPKQELYNMVRRYTYHYKRINNLRKASAIVLSCGTQTMFTMLKSSFTRSRMNCVHELELPLLPIEYFYVHLKNNSTVPVFSGYDEESKTFIEIKSPADFCAYQLAEDIKPKLEPKEKEKREEIDYLEEQIEEPSEDDE